MKASAAARAHNIDLIAIGVGVKNNEFALRELRSVANNPDNRNLMVVDRFDQLMNAIIPLFDAICNSKKYYKNTYNQRLCMFAYHRIIL